MDYDDDGDELDADADENEAPELDAADHTAMSELARRALGF
jgi:hypothetical protein